MNYAFIDAQNVHLAIRDQGWKMDWGRFRVYLRDKFKVEKAFLFIGYCPGNEALYTELQSAGYICVFKPTLELKWGVVKWNCDAELVLHCMIQYPHYDQAVIISGDGDFHCLIEYLEEQKKILAVGIPHKFKYSALLKKFKHLFFYPGDLKKRLRVTEPSKKNQNKSRYPSRDETLK